MSYMFVVATSKALATYPVMQSVIRNIGRCYIILDTGRVLRISRTRAGWLSESGAIGSYDIKEYHKVMAILDNNY